MEELCRQFEALVKSIWADPERRKSVVRKWNCRPFNSQRTTCESFMTFIRNILKAKCIFRIDTDRVWFLQVEDLAFPLSWFSKEERSLLSLMVKHCESIFGCVVDLPHGGFELSGCSMFDQIVAKYFNRILVLKEFAISIAERGIQSSENPRPDLFLHLKRAITALMLAERDDGNFNPQVQWIKNLRALDRALKGRDVMSSLDQIEVLV